MRADEYWIYNEAMNDNNDAIIKMHEARRVRRGNPGRCQLMKSNVTDSKANKKRENL